MAPSFFYLRCYIELIDEPFNLYIFLYFKSLIHKDFDAL